MALASVLGLMEGVERWAYDLQFELRGPIQPQTPIIIVSIDEDSFDELNLQWPWPRALHGQFLDIVSKGRPAVVGFDIVFPEPSSKGPEDDKALAEAVGLAGNVVLGAAFTEIKSQYALKEDLNPPVPVIRERAAAYGFVNPNLEDDAFVRSASLTRFFQGKEVPSFDLQLYRLGVKAGLHAAALPERPRVLINYRGGPQTFLTIPYYQVLNGEIEPDIFAGAIVLVGSTSPILHDVFPTPFATHGEMPGVEVHANFLETLFQGIPLRRASAWVGVVLTLAAGFLAVLVTDRLRPLPAMGLMFVAAGAYAAATYALFVYARFWMDAMAVPSTLALGYGATVVENFIKEQREKKRLSRYFSPAVVEDIISKKEDVNLGSARRRVTILFSDIRGFTSISEKMSPEDVVGFLREYLTVMTDAVFQHGGTVDKYIGDAVMALYNVPFDQPDHAAQAVRTALAFQERVKLLSEKFKAKHGLELRCGVGVHTGDAVVGTIGAEQRLEYTAIGDTINLGSRLESITKEYHVSIIISESTYEEVKGQFLTRYLGEVKVKGKEIPVKIYAVAESNLRRDERLVVKAAVTIFEGDVSIAEFQGDLSVAAPVDDLSRGGCAAHNLPKEYAMGQVVQLRLDLQDGSPPINVKGKVAWVAKEKAGFAFVDLAPGDKAAIERVLAAQSAAAVSPERRENEGGEADNS